MFCLVADREFNEESLATVPCLHTNLVLFCFYKFMVLSYGQRFEARADGAKGKGLQGTQPIPAAGHLQKKPPASIQRLRGRSKVLLMPLMRKEKRLRRETMRSRQETYSPCSKS